MKPPSHDLNSYIYILFIINQVLIIILHLISLVFLIFRIEYFLMEVTGQDAELPHFMSWR